MSWHLAIVEAAFILVATGSIYSGRLILAPTSRALDNVSSTCTHATLDIPLKSRGGPTNRTRNQ